MQSFVVHKKLDDIGLSELKKRQISIKDHDCITKLNELPGNVLKDLGFLYDIKNRDLLSR